MGKSNGRSKKTNSTRKLTKKAMRSMAGGFDFSQIGAFAAKELATYGPSIIDDFFKFMRKQK